MTLKNREHTSKISAVKRRIKYIFSSQNVKKPHWVLTSTFRTLLLNFVRATYFVNHIYMYNAVENLRVDSNDIFVEFDAILQI